MHKKSLKNLSRLLLILCLVFSVILPTLSTKKTSADTSLVRTSGATSNSAGWTNSNNANGTADDNSYASAAVAKGTSVSGDWGTYGFDSILPADATITKVEIITQFKVDTTAYVTTIASQAIVGGVACPTTATPDGTEPAVDTDFVNDITTCRTWTRANLLNASFSTRVIATRSNAGPPGTATYTMDYATVRVTFNTNIYNQAAYRWYEPADSTTPGTALANQDTPVTLYAPLDKIRLRFLLDITSVNVAPGDDQFKLQFGQKSGTCGATTYADVTGATSIAYYNNTTPTDNTTISTTGNDPTYSGHTNIAQKYSETGPINIANSISIGQAGVWDASLIMNGAPANTTYCFRVIKNGGTTLSTYTSYPELTTSPAAALDADFVDASGNSVASPSVSLSTVTLDPDCQTSTGTLGISMQKIRVRNTTAAPAWSLTIAATSGNTALWSAGTPKFDFNDGAGSPAGCSAGLDSDAYAGQLTINAAAGTLTARSVCSTTGVSKGASAAFDEGVTDSVSLLSASISAETGCYWELIDASLSQKIPDSQSTGSYSINLTMTVVAL